MALSQAGVVAERWWYSLDDEAAVTCRLSFQSSASCPPPRTFLAGTLFRNERFAQCIIWPLLYLHAAPG